jgi:hypothetical protein
MMEAVARRKAQWLFSAGSEEVFNGKRRPQEDMVTSAVFGSLRLMSPEDRRKAIEVILGEKCFTAAEFSIGSDVEIGLWPCLQGAENRRYVEPDVLLTCSGKTVVIEVKWHAPLSERQLEQQIEAAKLNDHDVSAALMLGEAGVDATISQAPCFRRTWREVSGEVQARLRAGEKQGPFGDWLRIMRDFLYQTDMGRIFTGLKRIHRTLQPVTFLFIRPGHPPWLFPAPKGITHIQYQFGEKNDR